MTEARGLRSIALRSLLFTFLVPGTVGGYLPWSILHATGATLSGSPAWRWLGLIPLLLGLATYVWCVADFALTGRGTPAPIDPPKELVVRGLYRVTRNPMYLGVLSVIAGESWLFGSAPLAFYTFVVFACFHCFVVGYEEPTLRRSFEGAYQRYCAAVPRWLPRLRRHGAFLAVIVATGLVLACGERAESPPPPAAPPSARATDESAQPTKQTGSNFAYLREQVGKYPRDIQLFDTEPLHARLVALLTDQYPMLVESFGTQGPLSADGPVLYTIGNKPHAAGDDQAILLIDVDRDVINVKLMNAEEMRDFRERNESVEVPGDVQTTIANWEELGDDEE
ncbi:MAG: isoprenylcysteine carboxylmethyltransferase family protein [Proteobacteria bacterium]|nr:isoprenylcysteine carboxylmethyltransferase family protein [Pseudomonadota bacterium]